MKILKKSQERTEEDRRELSRLVQDIIDNVRANKDEALKEYGRKFDACEREQIRVSKDEIEEAYAQLSEEEIADLKAAASNIRAFAKAQRETVNHWKTSVRCRESFSDTELFRLIPAVVMYRVEIIHCIPLH